MTTDPSPTVWDDEEAAREAALEDAGLADGDAPPEEDEPAQG